MGGIVNGNKREWEEERVVERGNERKRDLEEMREDKRRRRGRTI